MLIKIFIAFLIAAKHFIQYCMNYVFQDKERCWAHMLFVATLCKLYTEYIMRDFVNKSQSGISTTLMFINNQRYADDIVLIAKSRKDLNIESNY